MTPPRPGIAAAQDEIERPHRRLLELVRDASVPDRAKLEALAQDLVALRILDTDHAARIQVVVEGIARIETVLATQAESLAATQLYAMRAEAVARRIEDRVRPPPRWNRGVKAAFALFSAVLLILAKSFSDNPQPYFDALERWFR